MNRRDFLKTSLAAAAVVGTSFFSETLRSTTADSVRGKGGNMKILVITGSPRKMEIPIRLRIISSAAHKRPDTKSSDSMRRSGRFIPASPATNAV